MRADEFFVPFFFLPIGICCMPLVYFGLDIERLIFINIYFSVSMLIKKKND